MHNSGGDVDSRGVEVFVGAGNIWKISILSTQFCCEPITTLKKTKSSIKKKCIPSLVISKESI